MMKRSLLIIIGLVTMFSLGSCTTTDQASRKEALSPIEQLIQTGLIGKIQIESNEVWVDEYSWHSLNVQQKETFVYTVSNYFKEKRGYERVTVYGWHTGKTLAKTGLMGIKFY